MLEIPNDLDRVEICVKQLLHVTLERAVGPRHILRDGVAVHAHA